MLRHDTCPCGEKAVLAGLCSACIRIQVERQIERIQHAGAGEPQASHRR